MVMFGAPAVFHGLWMTVQPFIAEETRCASVLLAMHEARCCAPACFM